MTAETGKLLADASTIKSTSGSATLAAGTDIELKNSSSVTSGDAMNLTAGQDAKLTNSGLTSGTTLGMTAGNDISLTNDTVTSSGNLSMTATKGNLSADASTVTSTSGTATLAAGTDITLTNKSSVTSGKDMSLTAGNDASLTNSGLTSGSTFGMTAGRHITLMNDTVTSSGNLSMTATEGNLTADASIIESTSGSATLAAGTDMLVTGSTVTSGLNLGMDAKAGRLLVDLSSLEAGQTMSLSGAKRMILSGTELSAGNDMLIEGQTVVLQPLGDATTRLKLGGELDITGDEVLLTSSLDVNVGGEASVYLVDKNADGQTRLTIEENVAIRKAGNIVPLNIYGSADAYDSLDISRIDADGYIEIERTAGGIYRNEADVALKLSFTGLDSLSTGVGDESLHLNYGTFKDIDLGDGYNTVDASEQAAWTLGDISLGVSSTAGSINSILNVDNLTGFGTDSLRYNGEGLGEWHVSTDFGGTLNFIEFSGVTSVIHDSRGGISFVLERGMESITVLDGPFVVTIQDGGWFKHLDYTVGVTVRDLRYKPSPSVITQEANDERSDSASESMLIAEETLLSSLLGPSNPADALNEQAPVINQNSNMGIAQTEVAVAGIGQRQEAMNESGSNGNVTPAPVDADGTAGDGEQSGDTGPNQAAPTDDDANQSAPADEQTAPADTNAGQRQGQDSEGQPANANPDGEQGNQKDAAPDGQDNAADTDGEDGGRQDAKKMARK
jgi:hypothetical protein